METSAKILSESVNKDKKQCFAKLNVKDVVDNKLFWRNVKHILAIKVLIQEKQR